LQVQWSEHPPKPHNPPCRWIGLFCLARWPPGRLATPILKKFLLPPLASLPQPGSLNLLSVPAMPAVGFTARTLLGPPTEASILRSQVWACARGPRRRMLARVTSGYTDRPFCTRRGAHGSGHEFAPG